MRHFTRYTLVVGVVSFLTACAATTTQNETSNIITNVTATSSVYKSILHQATSQHDASQLSLEKIMSDPDWIGNQPESPYWGVDSKRVIYSRKQVGSVLDDVWIKFADASGNGELVPLANRHQFSFNDRVFSQNKKHSAWTFEGNIFYQNAADDAVRQLTKDKVQAYNLQFLIDGRLSFQSADRFVILNPATGFREQVASWKFDTKPQALEDSQDYIALEQQKLIQVVAKKRKDKFQRYEQEQALQQSNASVTADDFYLPKGHKTVEASLSPNGKWAIIVEQEGTSGRDDSDIMPNYINEDGRIKADSVRRRVADSVPLEQTIWLLDLSNHQAKKLSYTDLPGYNDDVLAEVKRENALAKGEKYQTNRLPRTIGLIDDWGWSQSAIQWQSDGDKVAIMLAAFDNKDRWLSTIDPAKAKLVTQHRLHDDAWINYRMNSFGWFNHSDTLYFLSEQSGYGQLYLKPLAGKVKPLTQGQYEIDELTLSADDNYIYFQANKKHPGIYEIYRVNTQNAQIDVLTDLNGMTTYSLSPDESTLLLTHSTLTMPPELFVKKVTAEKATQITHTVSEEFLAINWLAPDIVPIPSSHTQQPIFARVYAAAESESNTKRRAVVFNHGAGYLQNSHLGWSAYFREYMFHNLLVQKGYVVLDMDYRASKGYGRDWRTAIYRHMGKPEIEDLRDGVNWLVEHANVDRERVGTYGGSYGGFMTFMALFTAPDLFQAGAALRPVSDWAHYNFGYTSNILNTPDVDPIAYERSSPLYFAEGLEKNLLINAPMVDNNVFFQDTVRLVQRLIELEKQDFETAIYPVESHGFVQPSSWLDEYRRILKLFETHL